MGGEISPNYMHYHKMLVDNRTRPPSHQQCLPGVPEKIADSPTAPKFHVPDSHFHTHSVLTFHPSLVHSVLFASWRDQVSISMRKLICLWYSARQILNPILLLLTFLFATSVPQRTHLTVSSRTDGGLVFLRMETFIRDQLQALLPDAPWWESSRWESRWRTRYKPKMEERGTRKINLTVPAIAKWKSTMMWSPRQRVPPGVKI